MNKHQITLSTIFFLLNINLILSQSITISPEIFKNAIGNWHGSLTYLDYSSNQPYTMPANVKVEQISGTNNFIFTNIFPKEMGANSTDTLTISENGKMINKKNIRSIQKHENVNTEIITEYLDVDGNDDKPAIIRHTYVVGDNILIMRKDVQFVKETEWIKRNEFSYTREPLECK
ncbi:MAG: hypothetical protein H6610_10285 [Ignavibacteriales bacterium]|nr:hypothetical protein [Ignavibacteriales bacterium]